MSVIVSLRAGNAKKEMAKTSVRGFFHRVIVNDNLEKAYVELRAVIEEEILNKKEGGGGGGGGGGAGGRGGVFASVCGVLESVGLSSAAAPYVAAAVMAGVAVGAAAYYKQQSR